MEKIIINGNETKLDNVLTLPELLAKLSFNAPYLAVAVNGTVVPRSEHKLTHVKDGDTVEVIHAVGGG